MKKEISVTEVATAVVKKKDSKKYLLAKRTTDTDIQPGKWNFPGGKIEGKDENAAEAARRELKEETKLKEKPFQTGESFIVETVDGKFRIHPVLFRTGDEPELNSEHTEYRWVEPEDLDEFETVKGLKEDLRKLNELSGDESLR